MAKSKDTPNLPSSSRMQMPTTGGNGTSGIIKGAGGIKGGGSVTSRVMGSVNGKGMKGSSPYGKIC